MAVQRVVKTETVSQHSGVAKKVATYSAVDQFIFLIFGVIEILLAIRFVFRMFGANTAAPIVRFVYQLTNILMQPYRFIFPTNNIEGAVFEWSVLVAMAFYILFAWIIVKIMDIFYTADAS